MSSIENLPRHRKDLLVEYVEDRIELLDDPDEWALLHQAIVDNAFSNEVIPRDIYFFLVEELGQEDFLPKLGSTPVNKDKVREKFDIDNKDLTSLEGIWDFTEWWMDPYKHDLDGVSPDAMCKDIYDITDNVDKYHLFLWYLMNYDPAYSFDDTYDYLCNEMGITKTYNNW